jgi:hypothetical protein
VRLRDIGLAAFAALAACTNVLGKFHVAESGAAAATVGSGGAGATSTSTGGSMGGSGGAATTDASSSTGSGAPKRAFVTDASYPGNFNGAAGAHTICQKAANSVNLGGTWVAWIADGNTPITCSGGPWVLVDGTTEVGGCTELMSGQLKNPLGLSEDGMPPLGQIYVWTGLGGQGTPTGNDCMAWTALAASGTVGSTKNADAQWTDAAANPCDTTAHLYCFEN